MPEQTVHHPIVAVTADTRSFENYTWHAAPSTYLEAAVAVAGVTPLIVPAFGDRIDFDAVLDRVDGVLATGSRSNVHPALFGAEPTPDHEPYDPQRDATSIPLIEKALQRGVPVLAICRGMQELNVALGGTLATEIQAMAGRNDHRAPVSDRQEERFAIRHDVRIKPGTCLARIMERVAIDVNSLHRQAAARLAEGLEVEVVAADGTVEAVSVKGAPGFAVGVQWHPEYWAASDGPSGRLFRAFGDAARAHAVRHAPRMAAE